MKLNRWNVAINLAVFFSQSLHANLPQALDTLRISLDNMATELKKIPIAKKPIAGPSFIYATFKDWSDACMRDFPSYADRKSDDDRIYEAAKKKYLENKPKILPYSELIKALTAFRDLFKPNLSDPAQWLGAMPTGLFPDDITKADRTNIIFVPFVTRKIFAPGSIFAIHGDWHGDVHSLLYLIREMQKFGYMKKDSFEISNPQFNFLFLGDAVDRGLYSLETIYTLVRLVLANPGHVHIMRGNHDDWAYARDQELGLEVLDSVKDPKEQDSLKNALLNWFNLLPTALYLATQDSGTTYYVQCCHGGIEVGYDPKAFLSSAATYQYLTNYKADREKNISDMKLGEINGINKQLVFELMSDDNKDLGLTWSDFAVKQAIVLAEDEESGRFEFGKLATEAYTIFATTEHVQLEGFLRAHQHGSAHPESVMNEILNNGVTPGIAKLWQKSTQENKNKLWPNIVCTFNVAPNTGIGKANNYFKNYGTTKGVPKDFYGLLTVTPKFEDWRLEARQIDQYVKK